MKAQTNSLVASLPKCKSLFEKADSSEAFEWKIGVWDASIAPSEVKVEQIRFLDTERVSGGKPVANSFSSRTAALRFSEQVSRQDKEGRSEKGHWGVWLYTKPVKGEDGKVRDRKLFQSVFPIPVKAEKVEAEKVETPKPSAPASPAVSAQSSSPAAGGASSAPSKRSRAAKPTGSSKAPKSPPVASVEPTVAEKVGEAIAAEQVVPESVIVPSEAVESDSVEIQVAE